MERKRGPGIKAPPPAIFLLAFIVGVWIEIAFTRLRIVDGDASARPLRIAGYVLILAGVSVAAWGAFVFRRHKTSVLPFRPATSLVLDGPYRFSRNPMYVGMSLAHVGGGLALNALWPILLLPAALAVLFALVIRKEERHLAENFGEEYREYRARVRRWL